MFHLFLMHEKLLSKYAAVVLCTAELLSYNIT